MLKLIRIDHHEEHEEHEGGWDWGMIMGDLILGIHSGRRRFSGPGPAPDFFFVFFVPFVVSNPERSEGYAILPSMIARLRGVLAEKEGGEIILDVGGVGYQVVVPLSTFYDLGDEGSEAELQIYTQVKEDALSLYGFVSKLEKEVFERLIQISGIGPKLAITILSGVPAGELTEAIESGDRVRLNAIPGIGKKTAERMILELRGKLPRDVPGGPVSATSQGGSMKSDVVSALINLGYPRHVADRAVASIQSETATDFEPMLKAALKKLAG